MFLRNGQIQFNLSHSGEWVVIACDKYNLGVDVEKMNLNFDIGIVEKFYATSEMQALNKISNQSGRSTFFYKLWVLKESYIKAIGRGLHCPLNSITFEIDAQVITACEGDDKNALPWNFQLYQLAPDYYCAICCDQRSFPEKITTIPITELIANIQRTKDIFG
jgi:4'-phosphopantetheinyl transferase